MAIMVLTPFGGLTRESHALCSIGQDARILNPGTSLPQTKRFVKCIENIRVFDSKIKKLFEGL